MEEFFIEIWNDDDTHTFEHFEDGGDAMKRIAELAKEAKKYCVYMAECIIDNS